MAGREGGPWPASVVLYLLRQKHRLYKTTQLNPNVMSNPVCQKCTLIGVDCARDGPDLTRR